ncbi:31266_t:CDS:1, partial [Racocetra persica]
PGHTTNVGAKVAQKMILNGGRKILIYKYDTKSILIQKFPPKRASR